jgi:hypothetical protein
VQDNDKHHPDVNVIPEPTALYRFFGADDVLLYVGITKDLGTRLKSHNREKDWFREVSYIRLEHFDSRAEAEQAEILAIRTECPVWNVIYRVRDMDSEASRELEALTAQITRLDAEEELLRERARELIVALLRAGESATAVASCSPYSYSHVRTLAVIAGLSPARRG